MKNKDDNKEIDIIDTDLYEEFEDEELYHLVQEAKKEALARQKADEEENKKQTRRPFPRWAFWLIAFMLLFQVIAVLPQTFSIPAINFLITSSKLSTQDHIKQEKKAVVGIETEDARGTGFSISEDGTILTNYHVVEEEKTVTVAYPDDGLYTAEVVHTYPEVDLAELKVTNGGKGLPYLELATSATVKGGAAIHFIGNPLRFQGIANQGSIIDYTALEDWDEEVVMIDAPIYRGNSGSPIIGEDDKVIGVVFATLDHEEYGRVGLFIPIEMYLQREMERKKTEQ
ncbi:MULTISPECIES: serine protease [unclassified Virgibacillus]|uniref:S1C family serine protease n=1 Tax=unclassified Virgibacillus TaxID=2620237 RepID=UPI0024DED166|nr:serine protease [Virgibacillus sp. LDC-1]